MKIDRAVVDNGHNGDKIAQRGTGKISFEIAGHADSHRQLFGIAVKNTVLLRRPDDTRGYKLRYRAACGMRRLHHLLRAHCSHNHARGIGREPCPLDRISNDVLFGFGRFQIRHLQKTVNHFLALGLVSEIGTIVFVLYFNVVFEL